MQNRYEREIYQFLSLYRFFSYALAVMFVQTGPSIGTSRMSDLQLNIVLSVVGVYTMLKVFYRLRWREGGILTYAVLGLDFMFCVLLVTLTNGPDSAFLLYSLNPLITAALLFEQKVTISLGALASLVLSTTYIVRSLAGGTMAQIMQGQRLTLLIIYSIWCLVIASLTYHTNLNIYRRIQQEAIMEERRRIRRELHDGVAQSLGYLNARTWAIAGLVSAQKTESALSGLAEIQKVVQNTYEDIREAIDQLGADAKAVSLVSALASYASEFGDKSSIRVRFDVPRAFPRISPIAELQLLRIVQEALTNVRRHAEATEVELKLSHTTETVEVVVRDNGRGFVPSTPDEAYSGYHGLAIMRERAEGLGGTLAVTSAPGSGTEVKVGLPIAKVRL